MALYESEGKACIISLFDIKKYFDSESIFDCLYELYKSNIKGKLYRLIFHLNENIRIIVKTPVGDTQPSETGPCLGQGTVLGAVVSSVNLDNGCKEYFHENDADDNEVEESDLADKKGEKLSDVKYGDIELKPILFQDDLNSASDSRDKAQDTNNRMEKMIGSKGL